MESGLNWGFKAACSASEPSDRPRTWKQCDNHGRLMLENTLHCFFGETTLAPRFVRQTPGYPTGFIFDKIQLWTSTSSSNASDVLLTGSNSFCSRTLARGRSRKADSAASRSSSLGSDLNRHLLMVVCQIDYIVVSAVCSQSPPTTGGVLRRPSGKKRVELQVGPLEESTDSVHQSWSDLQILPWSVSFPVRHHQVSSHGVENIDQGHLELMVQNIT